MQQSDFSISKTENESRPQVRKVIVSKCAIRRNLDYRTSRHFNVFYNVRRCYFLLSIIHSSFIVFSAVYLRIRGWGPSLWGPSQKQKCMLVKLSPSRQSVLADSTWIGSDQQDWLVQSNLTFTFTHLMQTTNTKMRKTRKKNIEIKWNLIGLDFVSNKTETIIKSTAKHSFSIDINPCSCAAAAIHFSNVS